MDFLCATWEHGSALLAIRYMPGKGGMHPHDARNNPVDIQICFYNSRIMDSELAMRAFGALSQPTRLSAFRLLIEHEPEGLPAGLLAEKLAVPPNTLSTHLRLLQEAGLVVSRRDSRQIIYRAQKKQISALAEFLLKNCCSATKSNCVLRRKR